MTLEVQKIIQNGGESELNYLRTLGIECKFEKSPITGKDYLHLDYSMNAPRGNSIVKECRGTVLDRDKNKKIITLLTTSGVVTVRLFGDIFTHYDRQISEIGADGKKHIKEKSIFTRGNKIVVSGVKREDTFTGKKYSRTPWHMVELIVGVNEDGTVITREREGVD